MATYRISQLAAQSGLSRSALLYYDRIRLLAPSGRTPAGYRVYTEKDLRRLEQVCLYREAGLALADIRTLLARRGRPDARVLEKRLRETSGQAAALRNQQRLLANLLKQVSGKGAPQAVDKALWVSMLQAAGMSEEAMRQWHVEFERRAPHGHQEFLASLGIPEPEIRRIRAWASASP